MMVYLMMPYRSIERSAIEQRSMGLDESNLQVFPTIIKYVPRAYNIHHETMNSDRRHRTRRTVKTCHQEWPSRKNAVGHPTACFQCVIVLQNMLSRFQIIKPNTKIAAPDEKTRVTAALFA